MDGIPTSIVESMAAGVPVLATGDRGHPRSLVTDGVSGILCEPDAESVAAAIRRFYAMPDDQVAGIVGAARARAAMQHDARRLVRVLRRVWENRTVDIVIVSWNGLAHLRAVIERVRANTALPYHLIVCDNQSRKEPVRRNSSTRCGRTRTTSRSSTTTGTPWSGPAPTRPWPKGSATWSSTSAARRASASPMVGNCPSCTASPEDERGRPGRQRIGRFADLHDRRDVSQGHPALREVPQPRLRRRQPGPNFRRHVQGGLFGLRRAMVDQIGGFSDDVPHD